MLSLSGAKIRSLRLRAQRLGPQLSHSPATVHQVVADVCGVQAQEAPAAALAVRVRSTGLTAQDVEHALLQERSVVRTWCMRGTLHLIAAQDLGWLLPLLGPIFVSEGRRRRAELGLDGETCASGLRLIREILASQGALTRAELVDQLASRGIKLVGQASYHLIRYAALESLVCLGPEHDGEPTYVLLSDWADLGPVTSREAAQEELARRYISAYGPAEPQDLARWSGLPIREARDAWDRIAHQLVEVETADGAAWMPKERTVWLDEPPSPSPTVRLLPRFDTYLLGYTSRDLVVAPRYAKRIHPGGGQVHAALLIDGWAAGTWSTRRRRHNLDVVVKPFEELTPAVHHELKAEVADLGRFLRVTATLSVSPVS